VLRRGRQEHELDAELRAHLELHIDENLRAGMDPTEARRVAHARLGGVEQVKERCREIRPFRWLGGFWLDVKLGLRMVRKSWGLTLVGGLAMTIVIGIGAGVFAFVDMTFWGKLPLDEGDRVVAIQTWDAAAHRRHDTSRLDFERWRDDLRSVEDIGAFQTVERTMVGVAADGAAEPVSIAQMTASGFQLTRVPPLLGRPLVEEDERDHANPVVVIGYDVWQSRFAGEPAVVGQTVRLGDTMHTVVGVMPEHFAFPLNYSVWAPLRADRSGDLRDAGPSGVVFARLAPGVTMEGAQAELTTLGLLPSAESSETDAQLHPRVVPYTFAFTGDFEQGEAGWAISLILFLVTLLLVPPCANIAILVYARTVTRQEEFGARYALGASRGRIVGQLFIEVLVLAAGAAGVALLLVREAISRVQRFLGPELVDGAPFWWDFTLSFRTVLFAAGLAVVAATVAGVVPALKATGRRMQSGLGSLGSRTSMQLGATWTVLVVAQVAFSMAALPVAVEMAYGTLRSGILGPGFSAEEYLTARVMMDRETRPGPEGDAVAGRRPFAARFGSLQAELVRQLEAEPEVLGVTVAAATPNEARWRFVDVDTAETPGESIFTGNHLVRSLQVDDVFFDVYDLPLLTGRGFDAGDFEPERAAVVVNRTFADTLLGDGNPLGRRVRYFNTENPDAPVAADERWYEIVGVVADQFANTRRGTMFHPASPGQIHPTSFALRVGSNPAGVSSRLREITSALDPALRVDQVRSLDEIHRQQQEGNYLGASALTAVTLSVLLLSAAGMYSLMSFTVNQRRREIGIRSALGAQPRRLLSGIFRRAVGQLAAGTVGGVLAALLLDYYVPAEEAGGWNIPGVIPLAAMFMMVIGLLAAAGPARRGLRVEPTEALRDG
jgi:predicted permease